MLTISQAEADALREIERIEKEFLGPYAFADGDDLSFMDRETRARLAEIGHDVNLLMPTPPDGYQVRVAGYHSLMLGREYIREIPLALLQPAYEAFQKTRRIMEEIDREDRELQGLEDEGDDGSELTDEPYFEWLDQMHDCPFCGIPSEGSTCPYCGEGEY